MDTSDGVDEFALIAEFFRPLSGGDPAARGLADDAAFLAATPGFDTVLTVDALVAGVHFLADDPPDLIARKLVRVNLSDLAAKGAVPVSVLLAAAFPRPLSRRWLDGFAAGLRQDLDEFGVTLIGGDTVATPGPLTLSLTAIGRVAAGRGLDRRSARPGDELWITGTIGDGTLGLRALRDDLPGLDPADLAFLADRYHLPRPRLAIGHRLIGLAHAAMDVSDGLVQDLGHLCRASGVGAVVEAARVPVSPAAGRALDRGATTLASLLSGGDDYEVLFTAPPHAATDIAALDPGLARIGAIIASPGVAVVDADGHGIEIGRGGWRHFGAGSSGGDARS